MQHPLRHFFSHRLPRGAQVSCVKKGKPPPRPARRGSRTLHRLITDRLPTLLSAALTSSPANLVAASDLLHAPVIPPNRHCPAAGASVAALISIVVTASVMALSPTRPAQVDAHAARTDVHTLRKRRCGSRGS